MGFFDRISAGLSRSRDRFKEQMNILLDRGPDLDDEFWEELEETLILADMGASAAGEIVENLQDQAKRQALPDAYAVLDLLNEQIASTFTQGGEDILGGDPALVLFVGINGTGKTTTVGKIAKEQTDKGRHVILGSADTFRAAAIEQLEVWAQRAQVEMVTRERGSDPASVCYDTIERAEANGADLVLIDTAGRLHTSNDLMRELGKVVSVVRKRSALPVFTVLVIDATTGQNGLQQAREFNKALQLDALIVTKLDGTAKGGIALAVSHELKLPIIKIGVGEGIEDLRDFNPREFARGFVGDFDERDEFPEDATEQPDAAEDVQEESAEAGQEAAWQDEQPVAEQDALEADGAEEVAPETEVPVAPAMPAFAPAIEQAPEKQVEDQLQPDVSAEQEEEPQVPGQAAIEREAEVEAEVQPETEPEVEPEPEPEPEPEKPAKKSWWQRLW